MVGMNLTRNCGTITLTIICLDDILTQEILRYARICQAIGLHNTFPHNPLLAKGVLYLRNFLFFLCISYMYNWTSTYSLIFT